MEEFWRTLVSEWPTTPEMLLVTFRMILAAFVGALPGLQRERVHVAAGLRTHILVSMGAALFVLGSRDAGVSPDDTTRVIQGVATGIGFVGAGAILKSSNDGHIQGLTTASSIWLTAALGVAVGMGRIWLPLFGSAMAIFILSALRQIEKQMPLMK